MKLGEILAKKIGFGSKEYDYSRSVGLTLSSFTEKQLKPLGKKLEAYGSTFEEPFGDLASLVDKFGKLVLKGSSNQIFNLDSLEDDIAEYIISKLEGMEGELEALNRVIIDIEPSDMDEETFDELVKPMVQVMQTLEDSMDLISKNAQSPSNSSSIGFNVQEEYGMRYELEKFEDQIKLEHGPQMFRDLQLKIQDKKEDEVAAWFEEQGYIKKETTEFHEGFVREQIQKAIKK